MCLKRGFRITKIMSWDLKGKEISVFITGNFSADFIKIEARYKNRRQRIIKCFCILLSADNNDLKRIRDMNFKDLKQLCLYQDSKFILSYSLFAFLQGSAAGRTTPAFVVFVTGIGGAHLAYFWL